MLNALVVSENTFVVVEVVSMVYVDYTYSAPRKPESVCYEENDVLMGD